MSEPTTPTGKRLVSLNTPSETEFWTDTVLAIEREAAEPYRADADRLAEVLRKADSILLWSGDTLTRRQVHAALAAHDRRPVRHRRGRSTVTPQEALAQALPGAYDLEAWAADMLRDDLDGVDTRGNLAAAILDALPEGWYLMDETTASEVERHQVEFGAQQERERLREAIERLPSPVFMPQDIERIYAGESLPLVTRYAVLNLLDPEEADHEPITARDTL